MTLLNSGFLISSSCRVVFAAMLFAQGIELL